MTKIKLTSKQRYRQMASATRRAANRYFKRGMDNLTCRDYELIKLYEDDLKELRSFAKLVNQGQLTRASKMIDRMDTAVYEVIPNQTYNYVTKVL